MKSALVISKKCAVRPVFDAVYNVGGITSMLLLFTNNSCLRASIIIKIPPLDSEFSADSFYKILFTYNKTYSS